jgi:hypothetical protein
MVPSGSDGDDHKDNGSSNKKATGHILFIEILLDRGK